MSIITMPTGLLFGDFTIGQRLFDLTEMSESSGATATRLMGPPRWTLAIAAPSNGVDMAQAGLWESMLLQLRGGVNHLAAWDIVRNAPRGTARGTMAVNGAHSAGANAMNITGSGVSATLLAGDWLQISSGLAGQTVKVVADITANGSGNFTGVQIEPPLRNGYSGGVSITWDKPLIHFKLSSPSPSWSYNAENNTLRGYALDFTEQWS